MQGPEHFKKITPAAEEQGALYAEQVKQLYSNAFVGMLATIINSLVLAVIQRDVTSRTTLIAWVALLAVISLWRYRDIRTFRGRSPEASEANHWGRRFIVGLAISGVAWGSSAIFLFPIESLGHQTFLAFVIGGMVAGAAAAFSSVMTAFLAYSVPALSPIIVRFWLLGDEFHLAMGGMTLLFGVMMFFTAMRINAIRIRSVKLRFENSDLVSYLTECKRMEEALRGSEEKYRALVEQSLQGTFVIQEMRIVFANQAFLNMTGYTLQELYSLSSEQVINIVHPNDQKRIWGRFKERLEGKPLPPTYNVLQAFRKDGSSGWVEYDAVLTQYGGRPAVQVSVVEITKRREAERALRESEQRYRQLAESAQESIFIIDKESKVRYINSAGAKEFGCNPDQMLGKSVLDLFPPNIARRQWESIQKVIQSSQGVPNSETKVIFPGREAWMSTSLMPLRTENGEVNQVLGIARDVTELKQAEEALADRTVQLERMNRKLVALNAELDDFTHMASHDLQEPLRTLTAFSDLLRKDLGQSLPERAARDLGFITDAAKRMQTLIRDLLSLSRAGRVAKKREKVSLSECADRALEALAMRIKERGAQITRDNLPEVWGDSTLLTELYQNLIGNALKFSGDQRPIIQLTFEEKDGDQIFGVKDNGIGIEPKYAQQIFQPFQRLHGRVEYEGSGIGLAICRKVVEWHGGKIWVESEPGKGAHFRFTISRRGGDR